MKRFAMKCPESDSVERTTLLRCLRYIDANGQLVDGKIKEITLKLQDSTLQRMVQSGITVKTVFKVKPGAYVVRSVVRGSEGEQLTSQNLATEIPR